MADGVITKKYGFSGVDADAVAWFPGESGAGVVHLKTLHTVSVSIHEGKGQVRRLGQRSIAGLTRSIRTIAGSMIFIVVNDHPLRELQLVHAKTIANNQIPYSWSIDEHETGVGTVVDIENHLGLQFSNRLGTLLKPFNLLLRHVTEYPTDITYGEVDGRSVRRLTEHSAAELISGIEFIDEGKVTSVNDIYTEITYSFIAHDYKPLAAARVGINDNVNVQYNPKTGKTTSDAFNPAFEEAVDAEFAKFLLEDS